jgi:uncharacterized protein YciI
MGPIYSIGNPGGDRLTAAPNAGILAPMTSVHDQHADTGYIVLCYDGPDGAIKRAAATTEHLAYIDTILPEINVAGPLYDASGTKTIGSLFCYRTKSLTRARELLEGDPYFRHGVFASTEFLPFLPAAGHYLGGKIW